MDWRQALRPRANAAYRNCDINDCASCRINRDHVKHRDHRNFSAGCECIGDNARERPIVIDGTRSTCGKLCVHAARCDSSEHDHFLVWASRRNGYGEGWVCSQFDQRRTDHYSFLHAVSLDFSELKSLESVQRSNRSRGAG